MNSSSGFLLRLITLAVAFATATELLGATFSVQPLVSTNTVGSVLQLTLTRDGHPAYDLAGVQWSKSGAALVDDERISGSQTTVLGIAPLKMSDSGTYVVNFTNVILTNISRLAATGIVYVVDFPQITGELQTQTRGADVTFTVSATGGLLSYQWLWQGTEIAGATSSSLRFTNAYTTANAGYYNVRVSNPADPEGVTAGKSLLFVKPAPSGTYQGIFYNPDDVTFDSSGFFQLQVSGSKNTFSGSIITGPSKSSFSGKFEPDQSAVALVPRKNMSPLRLSLQLLTVNDLPQITGTAEDEQWVSSLSAHRLYYSGSTPTSLAGKYTLALQNTNTSAIAPNGDPVGTFTVSKAGKVTLRGWTSDGTSISQTAGISRAGDWPFYAWAKKPQQALAGWLHVQKQTGGSVQSTGVVWTRPQGPGVYPDGFGLFLQPAGSTYTPPTTNSVLGYTNSVASIYGGDLFMGEEPLWTFIKVTVRPPSSLKAEKSPENLELSLNRGQGTLSGSFKDSSTGRKATLRGVALQQQGIARGFFTSTNSAGAFSLVPSR